MNFCPITFRSVRNWRNPRCNWSGKCRVSQKVSRKTTYRRCIPLHLINWSMKASTCIYFPSQYRHLVTYFPLDLVLSVIINNKKSPSDVPDCVTVSQTVHDGVVYKLSSLLTTVGNRVKVDKITPTVGNKNCDIEIKDYVVLSRGENNDLPPLPMNLVITILSHTYVTVIRILMSP